MVDLNETKAEANTSGVTSLGQMMSLNDQANKLESVWLQNPFPPHQFLPWSLYKGSGAIHHTGYWDDHHMQDSAW